MEIGAEAALFPEKEYISGIFVAQCTVHREGGSRGVGGGIEGARERERERDGKGSARTGCPSRPLP